ncbi:MAG TPA: sigma-70 family RNA polymerase sigma factor [Gemmataceae bacterium]|nr:sigma-70 family RNA polymerase sigma factor [Gemmataceae bacterium]
MDGASRQIEQVQLWIERLQAGDAAAREQLLGHACDRLRRLTRKMLKDFARVKRWELTDDVLQNSLLRLWTALGQVTPRTARDFYTLAALQIRRELIDLARHHYGPEGIGANLASSIRGDASASTPADQAQSTLEPSQLAIWTEFHQQVDTLPDQEREVFDLLWYQGLTQPNAAALLGISEATLRRRWLAARQRLHQALKGNLPGS